MHFQDEFGCALPCVPLPFIDLAASRLTPSPPSVFLPSDRVGEADVRDLRDGIHEVTYRLNTAGRYMMYIEMLEPSMRYAFTPLRLYRGRVLPF